MMDDVRLSVRRVTRPNSRTERPRSPKLAGWKPIRLVIREPIYFRGQKVKGQGHQVD